jgi:hypothetical protein
VISLSIKGHIVKKQRFYLNSLVDFYSFPSLSILSIPYFDSIQIGQREVRQLSFGGRLRHLAADAPHG